LKINNAFRWHFKNEMRLKIYIMLLA